METEIRGEKWESTRKAESTKKWVEKMAREKFFRQRTKQTLSAVLGDRKRTAKEKLFSLLRYDLIVRLLRAENGKELAEELKNQMHEVRVKLREESGEDLASGCRMKEVDKFPYSGSMVSASLAKLDKGDFHFRNRAAMEVLEEFMGYCVEWEMDGKKSYVGGAVIHFAQHNAWTGSVNSMLDIEVT